MLPLSLLVYLVNKVPPRCDQVSLLLQGQGPKGSGELNVVQGISRTTYGDDCDCTEDMAALGTAICLRNRRGASPSMIERDQSLVPSSAMHSQDRIVYWRQVPRLSTSSACFDQLLLSCAKRHAVPQTDNDPDRYVCLPACDCHNQADRPPPATRRKPHAVGHTL
jgi:hypothetical protein